MPRLKIAPALAKHIGFLDTKPALYSQECKEFRALLAVARAVEREGPAEYGPAVATWAAYKRLERVSAGRKR